MSAAMLERRRRRLSRTYELISTRRLDFSGHRKPDMSARLRRFAALLEHQFLPHYFSGPPNWRLFLRQWRGPRVLPDFCIIGPPKSGTSDLAVSLMQHPNVTTPLSKEFWSPDPQTWRIYYPTQRSVSERSKRLGPTLSPYFVPCLHHIDIVHGLAHMRPKPRIVLMLRNPTDRVFSQWKWDVFLSGSRYAATLPILQTFAAYVDRALESYPEYPMYTACGFPALQTSIYWKAVGYWLDSFAPHEICVMDAGDYFRDRAACLREIQQFVGLPYVQPRPITGKVNENPIKLPPPDEASLSKLRAFFQPHNEHLWAIIGKQFNW